MNFKRVLVPVDFSVSTIETLSYAKGFAKTFDSVVDVLHVIQTGVSRDHEATQTGSLICALREDSRQELNGIIGDLLESEVLATVTIREGRAHETILREARRMRASLIIMGTRTHDSLSGLLRRHTLKRVIQNSPCPVLVVRSGVPGFETNGTPRNQSSFETQLHSG